VILRFAFSESPPLAHRRLQHAASVVRSREPDVSQSNVFLIDQQLLFRRRLPRSTTGKCFGATASVAFSCGGGSIGRLILGTPYLRGSPIPS
jgi:hypothetical protein